MVNFAIPVIFSRGRGHGLRKSNISKAQKTSDRIAQDIKIQRKTPQVMTAPTARNKSSLDSKQQLSRDQYKTDSTVKGFAL